MGQRCFSSPREKEARTGLLCNEKLVALTVLSTSEREGSERGGRRSGSGCWKQVSQEVWYPLLTRSWKRPSSGEEAARGVGRGLEGSLAAETQGSAEGAAVCEED